MLGSEIVDLGSAVQVAMFDNPRHLINSVKNDCIFYFHSILLLSVDGSTAEKKSLQIVGFNLWHKQLPDTPLE